MEETTMAVMEESIKRTELGPEPCDGLPEGWRMQEEANRRMEAEALRAYRGILRSRFEDGWMPVSMREVFVDDSSYGQMYLQSPVTGMYQEVRVRIIDEDCPGRADGARLSAALTVTAYATESDLKWGRGREDVIERFYADTWLDLEPNDDETEEVWNLYEAEKEVHYI